MKTLSRNPKARPAFALAALAAFVAAAAALALAGLSPSGAQTGGGPPAVAGKPKRVVVTPADINGLPPGGTYIIKTGTGTPILTSGASPSSAKNTNTKNTNTNGGGGGGYSGTTTVSGGTLAVYEFHGDRALDFGRVAVQEGEGAPEGLEAWLRRHRPADAMRGWPFKRLVIGPAEAVARVENWKGGTRPGTGYTCDGGLCGCTGDADCLKLADSGKCASAINCAGDGKSTDCFCSSR